MRRTIGAVSLAVAVGVTSTAAIGMSSAAAARLRAGGYLSSSNGWKRYPDVAPSGDTFQLFTTPSGYGAVAVSSAVAAVYASRNGKQWHPVPKAAQAFAGEVKITASSVGDGRIVVAGNTGPEGQATPTFWLSKDGKHWTKQIGTAPAFSETGDTLVNGLTRGRGKWVAVGGDLSGGMLTPAIWTSKDAKTWSRVATSGDLVTSQTTFLRGIASHGSRYVAVGAERDTAPGADTFGEVPIAYASRNGTSWTKVSRVAAPSAVTVTDAPNQKTVRRVVADGITYAAGRFVVWGSGTDALSQGSVSRAPFVVTSRNGGGGKGVVLPGPPPTIGELWTVTEVAGRGATLVAVGYHTRPQADGGAAIWVSKNGGAKWKLLRGSVFALPHGRTLGGPTHVSVTKKGVLVAGVAAGGGAPRPIAWTGGSP
jgi:hypothetical protein